MRHEFPVPPNCDQADYEAPRLAPKPPHWKDRVKALGNAVVPQVAYPIFKRIYEVLNDNRR